VELARRNDEVFGEREGGGSGIDELAEVTVAPLQWRFLLVSYVAVTMKIFLPELGSYALSFGRNLEA
jgi:hypothetical protein